MFSPKLKAWAWTFLVWLSLSIPGADLPLPPIRFDKVAHFILFFVFAWLWLDTNKKETPVIKVAIAVLVFGLISEVYQGFLPWDRIPDPFDSLANILGGFLAIGLYLRRKRRKSAQLGNKEVK